MNKTAKYIAFFVVVMLGAASCEKFLDRPTVDSPNESNFYQNEEQCIQGVNYLYNSPWNDFTRGFYSVGEILSGNMNKSGQYIKFTVNGTDEDLVNMSKSLWAVNTHCSIVYNRILKADIDQSVKNQCLGEALAIKALAYFFLVRTFGDVPLIHDISEEVASAKYNEIRKVRKQDVYEYVVLLLEKSMNLLPKHTSGFESYGRIDYYAAEALLAKVYLTKAGVTGELLQADLDKAAELAKDVIDNSGRSLMENYEDIFRGRNNKNKECLISWQWYGACEPWTAQNWMYCDMAMDGFTDFGTDAWGDWNVPTIDLQEAFGVLSKDTPVGRVDVDTRRKGTYMMAGDVYEYFWRDREYAPGKKGFDYLKFLHDSEYAPGGPGKLLSPTGVNCVKHLHGDTADHVAEMGIAPIRNMTSGLATHILRLADVYLIYTEAKIGASRGSTTDESAVDAFYKVRHRAIGSYNKPASVSWADVWKERRLELAFEGDRWYDFVRLAYYAPDEAIAEIKAQKRGGYTNLPDLYKTYYETGAWNNGNVGYDGGNDNPNVTESSFILPFPQEDVVFNKYLTEDPVSVDVRNVYVF